MNIINVNVMCPGVVWASLDVTVTTVSVTQAASMAPANSPGSVIARRAGVVSSATRVSLHKGFSALLAQSALLVLHLIWTLSKCCFLLMS